jgi:hypothetical protein
MKNRLLIATLVGVGFLATLGINAVREEPWLPAAAPVTGAPTGTRLPADAVPLSVPHRPATPTPAADPQPERERADSGPAPTYEEQSAARDRAAAHSARSR